MLEERSAHLTDNRDWIIWCKIQMFESKQNWSENVVFDGFYRDYSIFLENFVFNKDVLTARSSKFCPIIYDLLKQKKELKIVLKDIEEEVFEDLITFIYTGIAPNKKKFAEKLLTASLNYYIKELRHLYKYFAFKELSHEKLNEVLSFFAKLMKLQNSKKKFSII